MASIRKQKNKWIVDYCVGKRRRRPEFQTRADAERFRREVMIKNVEKTVGVVSIRRVSIGKAVEEYQSRISTLKTFGTQVQERQWFEHLVGYLGDPLVDEVSLGDLEDYQIHLSRTLKGSSVNRRFNCIRNFFRKCEDWNYCLRSPTLKLKNLKFSTEKQILWSDEQIEQVMRVLPLWAINPFLFICLTGARRGEVSRLQWSDVDVAKGVLNLQSFKGGVARKREIPFDDSLRALFTTLSADRGNAKHVFVDENLNPLSNVRFSTLIHRTVNELGIPGLNLKGLRHTLFTRMVAQDVSLEKVRRIAGHSNLKTTEHYLHLKTQDVRDSLNDVNSKRNLLKLVPTGS